MTFWLGFGSIIVLPILIGATVAFRRILASLGGRVHRGGWVYFLTPIGQDLEDAPIKIGMTHRDPVEDRMPEIRTMSPYPLRLLYKFYTNTPEADEHRIHHELRRFRTHGEWFDRDATLMYIDHLKGW